MKLPKNSPVAGDNNLLHRAGELFKSLGIQIVEVKDKVAGAVSTEFNVVKKAVNKKQARREKAATTESKKAAKKKLMPKKPVNKATPASKRPANKFQRKAKRAAKKSASNRLKK